MIISIIFKTMEKKLSKQIRIKNMPVLNVISQELYTTIIVFIANRRKDRMK